MVQEVIAEAKTYIVFSSSVKTAVVCLRSAVLARYRASAKFGKINSTSVGDSRMMASRQYCRLLHRLHAAFWAGTYSTSQETQGKCWVQLEMPHNYSQTTLLLERITQFAGLPLRHLDTGFDESVAVEQSPLRRKKTGKCPKRRG